ANTSRPGCKPDAGRDTTRRMHRLRYALLVLPVVAACGDDGSSPVTATEATPLPGTFCPDPNCTANNTQARTHAPTSPIHDRETDSETGSPTTTDATTDAPQPTSTTSTTDETSTTEEASASETDTSTTTDEPPVCPEDTILCDGNTAQVCDGMGGFKSEEACP